MDDMIRYIEQLPTALDSEHMEAHLFEKDGKRYYYYATHFEVGETIVFPAMEGEDFAESLYLSFDDMNDSQQTLPRFMPIDLNDPVRSLRAFFGLLMIQA